MSQNLDVRWKQRLLNYKLALTQLESAVQLSQTRLLSDLEKQGLIQAFEFTHEVSWNLLKDYIDFQGATQITGSRDATREAFNRGLIEKGEVWMDMIRSRNQSSHTYSKVTANLIADKIVGEYFEQFKKLSDVMDRLAARDSDK